MENDYLLIFRVQIDWKRCDVLLVPCGVNEKPKKNIFPSPIVIFRQFDGQISILEAKIGYKEYSDVVLMLKRVVQNSVGYNSIVKW